MYESQTGPDGATGTRQPTPTDPTPRNRQTDEDGKGLALHLNQTKRPAIRNRNRATGRQGKGQATRHTIKRSNRAKPETKPKRLK